MHVTPEGQLGDVVQQLPESNAEARGTGVGSGAGCWRKPSPQTALTVETSSSGVRVVRALGNLPSCAAGLA